MQCNQLSNVSTKVVIVVKALVDRLMERNTWLTQLNCVFVVIATSATRYLQWVIPLSFQLWESSNNRLINLSVTFCIFKICICAFDTCSDSFSPQPDWGSPCTPRVIETFRHEICFLALNFKYNFSLPSSKKAKRDYYQIITNYANVLKLCYSFSLVILSAVLKRPQWVVITFFFPQPPPPPTS